jgi:hypothetical protein
MEPQARTINLSRVFGMFGTTLEVRQDRPVPNGNGSAWGGHEGSLEGQLRYLNSKLVAINDEISRLEHQRDAVQLKMQHVARELHRKQATQVKEEFANGRRV